jgi:UDP-N-acetylmuramate dehydrogenase
MPGRGTGGRSGRGRPKSGGKKRVSASRDESKTSALAGAKQAKGEASGRIKTGGTRAAAPSPAERSGARAAVPSPAERPAFPGTLRGNIKYGEPLARHTTLRIGGPARFHFTPADADAAVGAVAWARQHGLPWLVLGLGSNVLVRDGGFPGLLLKMGKGLDVLERRGTRWRAGAGLATPLLARRTAEAGFAGVQRLIGVPGTVGGAVFMNAGAHGQDLASVLVSALLLAPSGEVAERSRREIPFAYRRSGLDGHLVLECTLTLEEDDPKRVLQDLAMVLKRRRAGTPFDQPCCGSVFKNPEGSTAGRLIDALGLKGRRVGRAEVSPLHANYIVNKGGASAEDVLRLIDVARTAVYREFGVELELEVQVIGEPA